jgi:hypothetical protein
MTDVACDACCMRTGISINISASDRERLEAMVAVRNSPQSMSGARGSSCSAPMAPARWRSWLGPANPRPVSGDGSASGRAHRNPVSVSEHKNRPRS